MKKHLAAVIVLLTCLAQPNRAAAQTDYLIGPQDVLSIIVFGEPEFSNKYTVEQDGTFTYPQLGRIKAGGLTLKALEEEIRRQLADGFFRNPQVAVKVEDYKSQRILVMGEVRSPGPITLKAGMTLLEAIAEAGSTTPSASDEAVVVRPRQKPRADSAEGEADLIRVSLAKIQAGDLSLNLTLRDGDTVRVPKAESVYVFGEVKNPNGYIVPPGTNVLQAITLAGGMTERGSDRRIRIRRMVDGKETTIDAKLIDIVKPGDTIIVRPSLF
jgi:polysaccharide export outer membrane protein